MTRRGSSPFSGTSKENTHTSAMNSLLGMPVYRAQQRVDIDERPHSGSGSNSAR